MRASAAEAVRRGLPSLVSFIHPDNIASQRVASAAGARQDGTLMLRDMSVMVFRYDMAAIRADRRAA